MKIYRLLEWMDDGTSKELFYKYNKTEFELALTRCIYNDIISYDPGCNYPSKEQQVFMLSNDLLKYDSLNGGIDSSHWVDIHELDPNKEREHYIRAKLQEHYKEALSLGHEIFALVLQGSQNYNLDVYTDEYWSDVDTKCIVLPSLDDIILNRKPVSTTHERDNKEHIDLKDIRLMFETFRKQNVNFVEVLFSDYYIVPDKYKVFWDELRSIAEEVVHAHKAQTLRAMSGMSMEKYKALKHRYPTIEWKIDKWGYDGKQLHHIIRINDFIKRYVSGMTFKDAMTPTCTVRKMLDKAKLNGYSLEEAEELAKKYDDDSKRIKDEYIEEFGSEIDNPDIYSELDKIQAKVLKQYFTEELEKDSL